MLWALLVPLLVDFLSIMIIFTFRVLSPISTAYLFASKLTIYIWDEPQDSSSTYRPVSRAVTRSSLEREI